MKVIDEKIGCKLLEIQRLHDNRGWFQVAFNQNEFEELGVAFTGACQLNHSHTDYRGTIRGLSYQKKPYQQSKLVRCIKGNLYSVGVDIDPLSSTYGKWCGFELSESNGFIMYLPRTYAHGFITASDGCELEYFTDSIYAYECAKSIHYNDPDIRIDWSNGGKIEVKDNILSEKNRRAPFLRDIKE